jgi:tryptophan synthase alpha chain
VSRLSTRFGRLREEGRKGLVTFITAGDPRPDATLGLMRALVDSGADVIELGVPFSDPMADGPVIQRASERALAGGMTVRGVLDLVGEFRRADAQTPVVLMGYLNPIEHYGYRRFAADAAEAGVDGFIIVDLPPEEAAELHAAIREAGMDLVFLLAPNSDGERVARICERASGFVYYVSLKGVTGAATLQAAEVEANVRQIKSVTDLPVGVGFGIRDGDSAARIARVSDAVVVGTALVSRVEALAETPEAIAPALADIVSEMRSAMDATA